MKDIVENTELLMAPGKTVIRYEPMGVVAIFSAWNYPVMTALKPLVQSLTTGNAVILKPSEIAANTSAVIKKFIDRKILDVEENNFKFRQDKSNLFKPILNDLCASTTSVINMTDVSTVITNDNIGNHFILD